MAHPWHDVTPGQKLPAQFRPWHAVGVVKPDAPPPKPAPSGQKRQ
jgi:hypothetical protein